MRAPAYLRSDARFAEPSAAPTASRRTSRGPSCRAPSGDLGRKRRLASLPPLMFGLVLTAVLFIGWRNSEEGALSPETGLGYWLGIAGASAMLLLLVYPLRKRIRALRSLGSISGWFRFHMILGLAGPALILFHSNFKLGSLNSNVALLAMLTVAGSGVVGRYLYSRVHFGLYGRRAEVQELLDHVDSLKHAIEGGLSMPERLCAALDAYARRALEGRNRASSSFFGSVGVLSSFRQRWRLVDDIVGYVGVEGKRRGWSRRARRRRIREARQLLKQFFAAVNKAAAFAFYERLFALWHVLHLPLFGLLVLAAIVHVIAVHLY